MAKILIVRGLRNSGFFPPGQNPRRPAGRKASAAETWSAIWGTLLNLFPESSAHFMGSTDKALQQQGTKHSTQ